MRGVQAEPVGHAHGFFVQSIQLGIKYVFDLGGLVEQFAVEHFPTQGLGKAFGHLAAPGTELARDGNGFHRRLLETMAEAAKEQPHIRSHRWRREGRTRVATVDRRCARPGYGIAEFHCRLPEGGTVWESGWQRKNPLPPDSIRQAGVISHRRAVPGDSIPISPSILSSPRGSIGNKRSFGRRCPYTKGEPDFGDSAVLRIEFKLTGGPRRTTVPNIGCRRWGSPSIAAWPAELGG